MKPVITAYGEALWDLLPDGPVLGGALLNFTYRAKTLGADAECITKLGEDDLGDKAASTMDDLGFNLQYVQRDPAKPTGTVEVAFDAQKNPSYTIIQNVAYDYISYTENLQKRVESSNCICFGSLIQRGETSRRTLFSLKEHFSGKYVLYDINLRKDCYTAETVGASLDICNIAKLNEEELFALQEMLPITGSSIREITESCVRRYNLAYCLVTLGDKGLFAVSNTGAEVYVPGISVELKDPIGAGDACTAGFICTLLEGRTLDYACKYANALGAAVAETAGATAFVAPEKVEEILRNGNFSPPHDEFAE